MYNHTMTVVNNAKMTLQTLCVSMFYMSCITHAVFKWSNNIFFTKCGIWDLPIKQWCIITCSLQSFVKIKPSIAHWSPNSLLPQIMTHKAPINLIKLPTLCAYEHIGLVFIRLCPQHGLPRVNFENALLKVAAVLLMLLQFNGEEINGPTNCI